MSRRHTKKTRCTIKQYLTRQTDTTNESDENIPEDRVDENLVQEDKMAPKSAEKKDVSNADLKGLIVGLESRLETKIRVGFENVTEKIDNLKETVDSLEVDVEKTKEAQAKAHGKIENLEDEVAELRKSLLRTQTYARKYHLLLYGVEGFETTPQACIERVRTFAAESLKLGDQFAKNVVIRNAHRLQKRDSGPTHIIVVFLYWAERDAFLRAGKNLAGTKMSVRSDLPPELKQQRGALAHEAFLIRRDQNIQARIQERGIDIYIETRKSTTHPWKRL
jgi:hypothetical protein